MHESINGHSDGQCYWLNICRFVTTDTHDRWVTNVSGNISACALFNNTSILNDIFRRTGIHYTFMFVSAVVNSYETRLPGWLDWIINNATRIQDHASWLIEWSSTDQRLKEDSHYRFRARITKRATIHIILARKEYWRETSTRCRLCREELASYSDCASSLIAQNASSLFGSQQKQDVLRSWVSMHQHCAPLHNPKISYTIGNIPKTEQLYIPGDFNARVGADHDAWPTCLGYHGMGKMNENGQILLCCHHGLSITNTLFENKPCHKVSWRFRRSGHWHQLDIVITRRDALKNVLNTRSYHSADCDTDHSLICARLRMQPKRCFHAKQKGPIRINIGNTTYPEKNHQFIESNGTALSGIETESA